MIRHLPIAVVTLFTSCIFGSNTDPTVSSPECTEYCDRMAENCSETFDGIDECLTTCEPYPSEPGDVIGEGPKANDDNTVQCRIYHANNAAAGPNGLHCQHASEGGGGTCVDFKGACGDYCGILVEACDGLEGAFADTDECETVCNTMVQGQEGVETGNTVHCRLVVANRIVAEQNPDLCPDALPESTRCVD